ncbi:MAG: cyclic nucleotide-binding domain-containing protein [Raineya sp.]|jgi:CRP-like cAMP-binding protein|nr:cyclic nucleotide-binding domain-containing protein [Raineya sp.]
MPLDDKSLSSRVEVLKSRLKDLLPISDLELTNFMKGMVIKHYSKGDIILRGGDIERYLTIVIYGITRHYIINKGDEINFEFCFEYEFTASYTSFIEQKPSVFFIEALEDTTLGCFSYDFLNHLYDSNSGSNRFGRIAMEQYFIWREKRELSLLTDTAIERYKKMLENNPEYVTTIPLKHLASYLNIKPESLSRIRKEISIKDL